EGRIRDDGGGARRRGLDGQEIGGEVEGEIPLHDVGGDDGKAAIAQHGHDRAVAGEGLPDPGGGCARLRPPQRLHGDRRRGVVIETPCRPTMPTRLPGAETIGSGGRNCHGARTSLGDRAPNNHTSKWARGPTLLPTIITHSKSLKSRLFESAL